jgi:hypothetical protein
MVERRKKEERPIEGERLSKRGAAPLPYYLFACSLAGTVRVSTFTLALNKASTTSRDISKCKFQFKNEDLGTRI